MLVCDVCHAENPDGSKHCHACGLAFLRKGGHPHGPSKPAFDLAAAKHKHQSMPLPALPVQCRIRLQSLLTAFAIPVVCGSIFMLAVFSKGNFQDHSGLAFCLCFIAVLCLVPLTKFEKSELTERAFILSNALRYSKTVAWENLAAIKAGFIWRSSRSGRYRVFLFRLYQKAAGKPLDLEWKEWKPEDLAVLIGWAAKRAPGAPIGDLVYRCIEDPAVDGDVFEELPYSVDPAQEKAFRARRSRQAWAVAGAVIFALILFIALAK
jgi:hypothetical protein